MNKEEKKDFVADLHTRLEKAEGTFIVDYKGLNVEAINRLRRELKKVDAEFQVIKNRLLKLASEETTTGLIQEHMQGPSAIALTYEDVVSPAKVLIEFAKDFQALKIKAGQISGKVVQTDGIRRLAELPGREVLLGRVLSVMLGVPSSFVRVLNGVVVKLLNVLTAIEAQKRESA